METATAYILRRLKEEGRDDLVEEYHAYEREYQKYIAPVENTITPRSASKPEPVNVLAKHEPQEELPLDAEQEIPPQPKTDKKAEFIFDREFNTAKRRMQGAVDDLNVMVKLGVSEKHKDSFRSILQDSLKELEQIKKMLE